MGAILMNASCILDPSVGNNSFLNYLHQKDIKERKLIKFSPRPVSKNKNINVIKFFYNFFRPDNFLLHKKLH